MSCSVKPSVPLNVAVTSTTDNSVCLVWEPPLEGAAGITQYVVEKKKTNSKRERAWKRVVSDISDTSWTVSGLTSSQSYLLRVAAVNDAGIGPFAELTAPVTTTTHQDEDEDEDEDDDVDDARDPGELHTHFVVL